MTSSIEYSTPTVVSDRADLHDVGSGTRIIFSSGGTTGDPKFTYLSFDEVLENCRYHGKAYASAGIRSTDVVAVWGLPGLMTSEFTIYLALQEVGACILPIGNVASPALIVEMLERFEATVLLVMPSNVLPVAKLLEERGHRLVNVRLVVTGGEPLYEKDRERYRALMSPAVQFRQVYQTSEVGTIGYQCTESNPGEFHVQRELQQVEIATPDEHGVGDLVVTNRSRQVIAVNKRLVGDRAKFIEGTCACDDQNPRIRLMGRNGSFVKLGGEKVDVSSLLSFRSELGVQIDDFKVEVHRDDAGMDFFCLFSDAIHSNQEHRRMIDDRFHTLGPKVQQQLEAGVVGRIKYSSISDEQRKLSLSGKFLSFEDMR